ncbi:MAG: hypothetical protein RBR22_07165 [Desulfuromonas sp.]|nr:hypothetical protein [Desulfuromonas sp.]
MYLLPRGKTIKESLDTARLKMPDALLKMCANHFSGYLSFETAKSNGVLCYAHGKIVAALWQRIELRLCGERALEMMFSVVQSETCTMGVYRLEDDFLPYVQQFCNAKVTWNRLLLDVLDIERLMARLHREKFTGCLRLYGAERVELIFYNEGRPLGFFCDGGIGLTTDVDVANSIAREENCLLDILTNDPDGCSKCKLAGINLEKVWLQVWRELNP